MGDFLFLGIKLHLQISGFLVVFWVKLGGGVLHLLFGGVGVGGGIRNLLSMGSAERGTRGRVLSFFWGEMKRTRHLSSPGRGWWGGEQVARVFLIV